VIQRVIHDAAGFGSYNVGMDASQLPDETARKVLDMISPGSALTSISVPPGSFSNFTHIVEARAADGSPLKVVVRCYKVFGDYDRGEKARREFKSFELLHKHGIPVPEPLLLDETGEVLGIPGIVSRFVPGSLVLDPPADPLGWARKLAVTLAKIHSIPCGEEEQKFLLKGNAEASWVVKFEAAPQYMRDYPGGAELWQAIRDLCLHIRPVTPSLVHIDYWSGNILWYEDEISAVIDWEEAAYGDRGIDVAYARMNMMLMGLPQAAEEFLHVYEAGTGHKVENLGFWELAAAVRPMIDPQDWKVHQSPGMDRFQGFIAEARKRASGLMTIGRS
jgi:aminoglycoside phosphotransferase (APT) family kinase protein